jgi:hypothetical protein
MHPMKHPLYMAMGGVCLVLAAIIVFELSVSISDIAASHGEGQQVASGDGDQPVDDADAMTASILERPIFAPDRRGPPAPKNADSALSSADKSAPEIHGRLEGVTIGPGDERQAVFARGEGEKPLVVREGDDVDGWTVSSIESGRVLLTSTFGQRTVEPTFGAAGETPVPTPHKTSAAKDIVGAEGTQPGPGNRRAPLRPVPGAATPAPGANFMGHRAPPIPPARRKDTN